ncbi:MAG: DNA primase [Verrucomicrobiota bacterium]
MSRIAEESIQRVADASDIVEIIGGYFPLKRAGTNFRAICPFHKEKSPSFHVNPSRQTFHCFGCGAGGGVFRFLMDYEHLDFPSAVRKLAQRAGIQIAEDLDPKGNALRDQRSRLLELHREATAWFHLNLLRTKSAEHARAYLKQRGLTKEISVGWQLGYAPLGWDVFRDWALGRGFSREELLLGGMMTAKEGETQGGYDRFRDRLMFPIRNDYGDVIGFSGRILNDSQKEAKYVNSPETPIFSKGRILFGLDKSKRSLIESGEAVVLEGQIDLISAFEHGVTNGVAPQGTAFTTDQARLLKRFVERVILCFDSDTAGQNAVERSLPALLGAGIEVRVARLPQGEDPDSLIRNQGVEAFRNQIREATDFFDHTIDSAIRTSKDPLSPRERATLANKLGAYLIQLPDTALRETTTAHVASRLGLSVRSLLESASKNPLPPLLDNEMDKVVKGSERITRASASTELICRLAILSPDVRHWLRVQKNFSPLELDPELSLLEELMSHLREDEEFSTATFLPRLPSHLEALVSSWELEALPPHPLQAAQDSFKGLRLADLKRQQSTITLELRKEGLSLEKMASIQKDILDLQGKINDLSAPVQQDPTLLR